MQKLTSTGEQTPFNWQIADKGTLPEVDELSSTLVHADTFMANYDALSQHTGLGIWLDSDDDVEGLQDKLDAITVIGIQFPIFADGRGFSLAAKLRSNLGYDKSMIALGNYMQDQLFYLKRCGFDAYVVADDADIESMSQSLQDFSDCYQAATDEPRPLFRRR